MRYTVTETPVARSQLARLWGNASSPVRAAITKASARTDSALRDDPERKGVPLSEGLYYLGQPPLKAYFIVSEPDRLVTITDYELIG
ncbi:MAG TPA: hypothetical protein VL371_18005 [Gemmataceae bacterium]|nr:hypothetical protein [Gemmataceae bacterium]